MVKIFVAQTHERERSLVSDFLKVSGYDDVSSFGTDPASLTWLSREMMFATKPFIVITSQRDMYGCDYISNLIHAVTLNLPKKTLTVVYTRVAAHQEHMPGVIRYFADLVNIPNHQLRIIPKVSDDTRPKEHAIILNYIQEFERTLI
jgi:hypothetical protein